MECVNRNETETLVCVRSISIFREYDFWVERKNNISGLKTLHYVKPKYLNIAMDLLLDHKNPLYPMYKLHNYKKGKPWKP